MPPRVFSQPLANSSHFHDEATVEHEVTCAIVRHAGTQCTCRAGPESGVVEGLRMEGPALVLKRFDQAAANSEREQVLEAENERLRRELARARTSRAAPAADEEVESVETLIERAVGRRMGGIRRGSRS